jgi:predicted enzyme related to lactoylglutathione lyase
MRYPDKIIDDAFLKRITECVSWYTRLTKQFEILYFKTINMKKNAWFVLALLTGFGLGFGFRSIQSFEKKTAAKKVTGIGGIFFKCRDPKKMREWYSKNLGFATNDYGAVFEWRQGADSSKKGFLQWSPFRESTKYFEPSTKDFMINYRVENLEGLIEQLRKDSVTITDKMENAEYGKFVHIMDIEGNKIELWEPNDAEYEKLGKQMGATTIK